MKTMSLKVRRIILVSALLIFIMGPASCVLKTRRDEEINDDDVLCTDENCDEYDDYGMTTDSQENIPPKVPQDKSLRDPVTVRVPLTTILAKTTTKFTTKPPTMFRSPAFQNNQAATPQNWPQVTIQRYQKPTMERTLTPTTTSPRKIITMTPFAAKRPLVPNPIQKQLVPKEEFIPITKRIVEDICDDPEKCPDEIESNSPCLLQDCGETLFLTQYIEKSDNSSAGEMARVREHKDLSSVASYSGILTTNKKTNSNVFFWFFPAMNKETSSPLIVWLEGRPCTSSLLGVFALTGPFRLSADMNVRRRNYTWANSFNMLYMDNLVGAGFSFTDRTDGYIQSQEDAAENLYNALQQFFRLFPDYRDNSVYISGYSEGGKYAVSLAYKIHTMGEDANIDLKGISLGSPIIELETMVEYGPYLYNFGILDTEKAQTINSISERIIKNLHRKQWSEAMDAIDEIFGNPHNKQSLNNFRLPQMTGMSSYMHVLRTNDPPNFDRYKTFVVQPEVRKALHMGDLTFQNGAKCDRYIREDLGQSMKGLLTILLNNYRMMMYSGNLDIIAAYPMVMNFFSTVKWRHAEEFSNSTRMVWKVKAHDNHVAGYVHHVKNFYEVMVRNAGHYIPYDQPKATLDMISRFIWGRAFNLEN